MILSISHPVGFLIGEEVEGVANGHFDLFGLLRHQAVHHISQLDFQFRRIANHHAADDGRAGAAHFDLDDAVIEQALLQLRAQLFAGARVSLTGGEGVAFDRIVLVIRDRAARSPGARGQEEIEDTIFGAPTGGFDDLGAAFVAEHIDGDVHEVADHAFHVAPDVADLGIFGCLDLEERRADQSGQASRDFGLSAASRSDHEDILGIDLIAQGGIKFAPAGAIAQCDGHHFFGVGLPHDIAVEFGDDFAGSQTQRRIAVIMADWIV